MTRKTDTNETAGRYSIAEGEYVQHQDSCGISYGRADSPAMMSSNRIKVDFTLGPRRGECRWVPLEQVDRFIVWNVLENAINRAAQYRVERDRAESKLKEIGFTYSQTFGWISKTEASAIDKSIETD